MKRFLYGWKFQFFAGCLLIALGINLAVKEHLGIISVLTFLWGILIFLRAWYRGAKGK